MASSHSASDPLLSEEQSIPRTQSRFQQLFETNLNQELLLATFKENSHSATSIPSEVGTSSPSATLDLGHGLLIPTKAKTPASGFAYLPALEKLDITKDDWTRFSDDIRSHARMTRKQWTETIGTATGTIFFGSLMLGFLSAVPGIIVGKKVRDKKEKKNFKAAGESGALLESIEKWNKDFFFSRGLAVRVDLPRSSADTANVDHSSSTNYKARSVAKKGRVVLMHLEGTSSTITDQEQLVVLSDTESAT